LTIQASSPVWARLAELGYVEGRNLAREERAVSGVGAPTAQLTAVYDDLAGELVRLPVDVLLTGTGLAQNAAARATASIPIVMIGSSDETTARGAAQSMARPGGNVTGVICPGPALELKRLQLLTEAAPAMRKVLVIHGQPPVPEDEWDAAAASLGIRYVGLRLAAGDDVEAVLARAVAEGVDGLLVQVSNLANANQGLIIALVERYRLRATYSRRGWVNGGGLMTYEPAVASRPSWT
jgi:putative ABC transport system substrate-binding protein